MQLTGLSGHPPPVVAALLSRPADGTDKKFRRLVSGRPLSQAPSCRHPGETNGKGVLDREEAGLKVDEVALLFGSGVQGRRGKVELPWPAGDRAIRGRGVEFEHRATRVRLEFWALSIFDIISACNPNSSWLRGQRSRPVSKIDFESKQFPSASIFRALELVAIGPLLSTTSISLGLLESDWKQSSLDISVVIASTLLLSAAAKVPCLLS